MGLMCRRRREEEEKEEGGRRQRKQGEVHKFVWVGKQDIDLGGVGGRE